MARFLYQISVSLLSHHCNANLEQTFVLTVYSTSCDTNDLLSSREIKACNRLSEQTGNKRFDYFISGLLFLLIEVVLMEE